MRHPLRKLAFAIGLVALGGHAWAADYYVSTSGDDDNPGTQALPWRSVSQASKNLQPGDTVFLRAGTYRERIIPARSGSAGKPITYQAYPGETARVVGDGSANAIVYLGNKEYITLDGLHVRFDGLPAKGNLQNIYVGGGGHHVLRNLTIVGDSGFTQQRKDGYRESGIQITDGSKDNEVANCEIHHMSLHAIAIGSQAMGTHIHHNDLTDNAMNSVTVGNSRYLVQGTLIENNVLGGSTVSDGIQTDTNYDLSPDEQEDDTGSRGVVVRNNIIKYNAENAIDLKSGAQWVIEGNIIYGATGNNDGGTKVGDNRFGGHGIHKGSSRSAEDNIIRNNVIYDNYGGVLVLHGYKVYNNTILNNLRDYTGPNSDFDEGSQTFAGLAGDWGPSDASILNNIIGDNVHEVVLRPGSGQELDHNIYFNTRNAPLFTANVSGSWKEMEFEQWRDWLGSAGVGGADRHSRVVEGPLFVKAGATVNGDYAREDFMLAASAAAVDAGRELTVATNGGSNSTTLKVKDAGFFFDGYGVTEGDAIRIGDNAPVRITRVDYGSDTLTLAKAVSWSTGDGVSLPYNGSAPDIGALEYDGDVPNAPPATPSGLRMVVSEQ